MSRRRASVAAESTSGKSPHASAPAGEALPASDAHSPAPPRKHPWQLAIGSVLLSLWILFLAWMAWGSQ